MKLLHSVFTLTTGLVLAAAPWAVAQDKGPNQAPPAAAAGAKASPDATAVEDLHLAHTLIDYGRKHKAPEALITAARILAANGTSEMKEKPTREVPANAPKTDAAAKPATSDTAKALLDEAKKLSDNNPTIVALANSVELSRGAVGGPKATVDVVNPLATDAYHIAFRGEEVARVALSGDGDTRLDLYIYDENDNLVTSQVGPGDDCLASWVPRWTGMFTIRVVNRGLLANKYNLLTN